MRVLSAGASFTLKRRRCGGWPMKRSDGGPKRRGWWRWAERALVSRSAPLCGRLESSAPFTEAPTSEQRNPYNITKPFLFFFILTFNHSSSFCSQLLYISFDCVLILTTFRL
jgi:hypothetical protein